MKDGTGTCHKPNNQIYHSYSLIRYYDGGSKKDGAAAFAAARSLWGAEK